MLVAWHLLNDYSGSPKVLLEVLRDRLARGERVELVSTAGGPLDTLLGTPGFTRRTYRYRFSNSGLRTMMSYVRVQMLTFCMAFKYLFRRDVTFYVNTLLPVGPALAGRLTGKRVVYHYHENATVKGAVYRLLAWAMQRLAHEIICVSAYQASFLKRTKGVRVEPNRLPADFVAKLKPDPEAAFERKRVLMLASLKAYKGTAEFIELARRMPEYRFTLVLNETPEAVAAAMHDLPANLTIYPRQTDVTPFYNDASVVVNLSNPRLFIETFGLTAAEAMAAGLPVIVPTVGGIAEIVEEDRGGYHHDVADLDAIEQRVRSLLTDRPLYLAQARAALCRN